MAKTNNTYNLPVPLNVVSKVIRKHAPHEKGFEWSLGFLVPVHTPVYAAQNGKVIDILDDSMHEDNKYFMKYGSTMELEHHNGEYSKYERLEATLHKVGDEVLKGETIAWSGATGRLDSLGPHLHFMVGDRRSGQMDYQTLEPVFKEELKIESIKLDGPQYRTY